MSNQKVLSPGFAKAAKALLVGFFALFVLFLVVGYLRGRYKRTSSEVIIEEAAMSLVHLASHENQFYLVSECEGRPTHAFAIGKGDIIPDLSYELSRRRREGLLDDSLKESVDPLLLFLGGASAWKLRDLAESVRGGGPERWRTIGGVLGAVFGYTIGYEAATAEITRCNSQKVRALLDTKAFWRKAERRVWLHLLDSGVFNREVIRGNQEDYKASFDTVINAANRSNLESFLKVSLMVLDPLPTCTLPDSSYSLFTDMARETDHLLAAPESRQRLLSLTTDGVSMPMLVISAISEPRFEESVGGALSALTQANAEMEQYRERMRVELTELHKVLAATRVLSHTFKSSDFSTLVNLARRLIDRRRQANPLTYAVADLCSTLEAMRRTREILGVEAAPRQKICNSTMDFLLKYAAFPQVAEERR